MLDIMVEFLSYMTFSGVEYARAKSFRVRAAEQPHQK